MHAFWGIAEELEQARLLVPLAKQRQDLGDLDTTELLKLMGSDGGHAGRYMEAPDMSTEDNIRDSE